MNPLNLKEVNAYVNENIVDFHCHRINSLEKLNLEKLIAKNPYLLKAKNIATAGELITSSLDALLSSSEDWFLISENKALYADIVEPIGYRAKEHNEHYARERARVTNFLTKQFIERFCDERGAIDWERLVEFNCGNYDFDKFLP